MLSRSCQYHFILLNCEFEMQRCISSYDSFEPYRNSMKTKQDKNVITYKSCIITLLELEGHDLVQLETIFLIAKID